LWALLLSSWWRRFGEPSGVRIARRRQVELVKLGQGRFEDKIASGSLKPLHQIAGPGVEDAVARLDQRMAPSR
jgi:hypothetical protein